MIPWVNVVCLALCCLVAFSGVVTCFPAPTLLKTLFGKPKFDDAPLLAIKDCSVYHIAVAPHGVVFFSDNDYIRMYDPVTNKYSTWKMGSSGGSIFYRTSGEVYKLTRNEIHKVARNGQIKRIAGTGEQGYSNTGIALTSKISSPYEKNGQMHVYNNGDVVFADVSNNIIRKVIISTGEIKTLAGNLEGKYAGDGGPAKKAYFKEPIGVAISPTTGELYIADSGNHRIRRVLFNGTIITVAGTGTSGFSGDGGLATKANLKYPTWLAFTPENDLVFIDSSNNRIRKLFQNNGTIVTIAGSGSTTYNDLVDGKSANLGYLGSVAIGPKGEVYFTSHHYLRTITADGKVKTLAGYVKRNDNPIRPSNIRISNDTLYFSDDLIYKVVNGTESPLFQSSGLTVLSYQIDASGNIYYSSNALGVGLKKRSFDGSVTTTIIEGRDTKSTTDVQCNGISGVGLSVTNSSITVLSQMFLPIQKIDLNDNTLQFIGELDPFSNPIFGKPIGFVQVSDDKLLIAGESMLYSVTTSGQNFTSLGTTSFDSNSAFTLGVDAKFTGISAIAQSPDQSFTLLAQQTGVYKIVGDSMTLFQPNPDSSTINSIAVSTKGVICVVKGEPVFILCYDPEGTPRAIYQGSAYLASDFTEGMLLKDFKLAGKILLAFHPITEELYLATGCKIFRVYSSDSDLKLSLVIGSSYCYEGAEGNTSQTSVIGVTFMTFNNDELFFQTGTSIKKIKTTTNTMSAVTSRYYGCDIKNLRLYFNYFDVKDDIIYVLETNGKISSIKNGTYSHFAGSGNIYSYGSENVPAKTANFINPADMIFFPDGRKLVLDRTQSNSDSSLQHRFRMIGNDGLVNTLNVTIQSPSGPRLDSKGNIYFADGCYLKKLQGEQLTIVAGNGICYSLPYEVESEPLKLGMTPTDVFIDEKDQIYFADTSGKISTIVKECPKNSTQNPDGTCTCFAGYYGDLCSEYSCFNISKSDPTACSSNGICIHQDVCQCAESYFGIDCNFTTCYGLINNDSSSCSRLGTCRETDFCDCVNGYGGPVCQFDMCYGVENVSSLVCSSHGVCVSPNNCSCSAGYYGENCDLFDCFGIVNVNSSVCSSSGTCVSPNNCECLPNYYGASCEQYDCYGVNNFEKSVCSSKGKCVAYNNCSCDPLWSGFNCNITKCFGVESNNKAVCSSHGSCLSFNNCSCKDYFYGEECNLVDCFGIVSKNTSVCSSKGNCLALNSCQCVNHYYGGSCNNYDCYGINNFNQSVCSSKGKCIAYNNCSCNSGWYGATCNITTCFGVENYNGSVCSSHGSCLSFNNCSCKNGYYGDNCEKHDCYGVIASDPTVCSSKGVCEVPNSCQCENHYYGSSCNNYDCYGINNFNQSVCSSKGKCIAYNNCSCNSGWYGATCNITTCFGVENYNGSVCSSHGTCVEKETCSCAEGYLGNNCQSFKCFGIDSQNLETCSGHGVCFKPDSCQCESGWKGNNQCSQFTCEANNDCYGNGQCVGNNTCLCNSGWTSPNCSIFTCSNNCYGNGQCIGNNTCKCSTGWIGKECNISTCYNISQESSNVCSGRGSCYLPNNCTCVEGYYGTDCSLFNCFAIPSGNSSVCQGKGQCIAYNKCKCNTGYYNNDCSGFTCSGIDSSNKSVCSTHGKCTQLNECNCENGYNGTICSQFECFGTSHDGIGVCSSKGKCIQPNICECNEDYYGNNCQLSNVTCFGVLYSSAAVCSGRGDCLKRNNCNCSQTFGHSSVSGSNCEILTCFPHYMGEKCDKYCEETSTCNSHGTCSANGSCSCYSNASLGYWVGENCTTCQGNYYGGKCQTLFIQESVRFDADGRSLTITTSNINNVAIQCKDLFDQTSLLGTNSDCAWNGNAIKVTLGIGSSIRPGMNISINVRVFEKPSIEYRSFQVLPPTTISPSPIPVVKPFNSTFAPCETVILDASSSFSTISNIQLYFSWSISPSLSLMDYTSSVLKIENVPYGNYSVSLVVSTLFNQSKPISLNFSKTSPVPSIGIAESEQFSGIRVNQVPFQVKHVIQYPACNQNDKILPENMKIEWSQIQGNSIFDIVNNNLVITSFQSLFSSQYIFQVTMHYFNTISTAQVVINTVEQDFSIVLYQSELNSTHVTLNVEIDPVEMLATLSGVSRIWSCTNSSSFCDPSIVGQLQQNANSTAIGISKSTIDQVGLSIRILNKMSDISIIFPEPHQVIPLVNVLSISPQRTVLNNDETLSVQVLVSLDGKVDGIDDQMDITWTLQGSSQVVINSKTSMASVDASTLVPGSQYTLTCVVTSLSSNRKSTYSYSFSVSSVPPICKCSMSATSGYPLETLFTLKCPDSCVTVYTTLKFSFKDSLSGAIIPLYEGKNTQIVTKLPYTKKSTLDVYFTVKNIATNAKSDYIITTTIILQRVTLVEWKKLTALWTNTYKTLASGDPQKLVFSYAQITSDAVKKLVVGRSLAENSCQNGGVYNPYYQFCNCPIGYKKENCEMSLTDWEENSKLRWDFQSLIIDDIKSALQTETLTDTKLQIHSAFLSNSLAVFDEVPEDNLYECLSVFELLLQKTLQTSYLAPASTQISIMSQVVNLAISAHRSLYGNDSAIFYEKATDFTNKISLISLRNLISGRTSTVSNQFLSVVSSKMYPTELSNKELVLNKENEKVSFASGMVKYIPNINLRKQLTTSVKTVYSAPSSFNESVSYLENGNSTITKSILNYVLNTNFTTQTLVIPEKDQVVSYTFYIPQSNDSVTRQLMGDMVLTTTIKTSFECKSDVPCSAFEESNNHYKTCKCSLPTFVTVELTINKTITLDKLVIEPLHSDATNIGKQKSKGDNLEYLGFLSLLSIPLAILLLFVVIKTCTRKPNGEDLAQPQELLQINV